MLAQGALLLDRPLAVLAGLALVVLLLAFREGELQLDLVALPVERGGNQREPIALDAADLGAVYLGGVAFATLAAAGRVRELTPGAIARADRMFAVQPTPWCSTNF